jgi:hypothetical protein
MVRWRRPGAQEMLQVFVLLNIASLILGWLWQPNVLRNEHWAYFFVAIFCAWRVSRGGWISRVILIMASCLFYVSTVLELARSWDLAIIALTLIYAAQIALVLSPLVYGRTRRAPIQVRAARWTQLMPRPPSWLLPWGLFLGVVLTLVYLGNMSAVAVPGCRPAASGACSVLAEGYPLRWLTVSHGNPVIDKDALVRDCAQWVLSCSSVLYLAWLWLGPGPAADPLSSPGVARPS